MVVAHQDDEVIFGGYDLFSNNKFLVIYCTNDNKRINMVKNLVKDKKFNAMIFHHIDSINENILFSKKLYDEYNLSGEYGHIQHILVHQMISNILFETKNRTVFKVFYDDIELDTKNRETKTRIMNKYYNFACDTYQKYYNYKSIVIEPMQYDLEKILFI